MKISTKLTTMQKCIFHRYKARSMLLIHHCPMHLCHNMYGHFQVYRPFRLLDQRGNCLMWSAIMNQEDHHFIKSFNQN